ncbi:MAG: lysophospholipid acyltransferase family protein [Acidobacteria bacterium]|nr:lysophospholipid acyltransferase family protein [Acidobacteriota bacterium]
MTDKDGQNAAERVPDGNAPGKYRMSFPERMKTLFITELGYWIILLVGRTLRWEVEGWGNLEAIHQKGRRFVGVFWHNRIFMTSYFFRNRNIVAMISRNRDGEYIARVGRRLGFGAARGSGSRGGRGAVVETLRALQAERDVFFTLDGPRGPRYIAKPGAAYVAGKSGSPILPFNISVEKKWVMASWDGFIVPRPFSRALVLIGPAIEVAAHADAAEMERIRERIQQSMNGLSHEADSRWQK